MCGIALLLSSDADAPVTEERLARMNDAQHHRGPDGTGIHLAQHGDLTVGLGHRRLSIVDLAAGTQPMSNEDKTVWVSYNGEIYNHLELREQLIALGHVFRTRCDTETIVHAYEQWGPECVHRFRGMFAFAIWDKRRRELFAARDRMGIKPFYYVHEAGRLIAASEIKSLVASGWYAPELNSLGVPEHFLFGYLAGEETLYAGVKKLMPGHWLRWQQGKLQIEQYWDVPLPEPSQQSEEELIEEFLDLFQQSVRLRLMADVPLGVFLSGGLDSSAIAAVMSKEMAEPVKTFSVGFESQYFSEFSYAREVAQAIGADHHEIVLKPERAFALLPKLIWHEDEPIRNPSSVALYEVSRLAREQVTVVLTGEGSDELFAGYERYWASLINLRWGSRYHRMVPGPLHRRLIQETFWHWPLPLSVKKKISHSFLNHSMRPEEIIFDNFQAIFPSRLHPSLFAADFWEQVRGTNPYQASLGFYHRSGKPAGLSALLYADQKAYLVELLMKQDTMSMATSIESRVPFLDHKLVEFSTKVPDRLKLRGSSGKYLVKQAMKRLLPNSILTRKKMGFPVPLRYWLRGGFDRVWEQVLLSDRSRERGILNLQNIRRLLGEHTSGRRDHADALWTLLNFELWARVAIDREDPSAVSEELQAYAGRSQSIATGAVG